MPTLNLFPVRVPIGVVTDSAGNRRDVMMTPEFSRALSGVYQRIGGADGMSNTELMKELARRPSTLAQSAEPVHLAGTLDVTVLATVAVPGDAMGLNGMLRITTTWSVANSANNKTVITRFGGSEISLNAVTTVSTYQEQRMIQNRNAADAQVFVFGGFGFTGAPIGTMAKDTTRTQNIEIAAQLSDIADDITLEAYTVELIPSP